MASLLVGIRQANGLGNVRMIEPFAGGAGASLSLLLQEEVPHIHINDADPAIFGFWWSLIRRPTPLLNLIRSTRVTMSEWRRQRDVYRNGRRASRLRLGFATFFLNRCNRSGIVKNGGPIGGTRQDGEWTIRARYNKEALIQRCERIIEYRNRIRVSDLDGLEVVDQATPDSILFLDPPYYHKGKTLYLNDLGHEYHRQLATRLQRRTDQPWVLTYDDCPEVRAMYEGWAAIRPFQLRYIANERRDGREIMITPKWIKLPHQQSSAAIDW